MKKFIIPIIAAIAIVGGAGTYAYRAHNAAPSPTPAATASAKPTRVSYRGEEGKTALQLLQKSHAVGLKHYSFGDMVESVDGTANTAQKSWFFYVNGSQPAVGADAYATKAADTVEWRYEAVK